MAFRDLRETLAALREHGRLLEVTAPVSPRHEVAAALAVASHSGKGAVFCSRVEGHTVPVVGNVVYDREVLGWALGVPSERVPEELSRRLDASLPARPADDTPVLEQTVAAEIPLQQVMPILTHYEDDSAPYITTGVSSARDPETGAVARGIHRMELRGERELGIALLNPPLADVYAKCKEKGDSMRLATVVGVEPLTFAAFALKGAPGIDKLALAGGLRDEAVETVRAELTGIPVPARAEFLLEGEVDPRDERDDGPLGEIGGYSLSFPSTPTFRVRRITHRANPIYHALLPTGPDGDLLIATVAEASVGPQVRKLFPFLRRIHFVPSTFGSSVVVQLSKAPREQARSLLLHLVTLGMVKKAVAVAEDVDPSDLTEVEWSIATRAQPDRDAIVVSDLKGQPIDPSCPETFRSSKLAIDATGYERVRGRSRAVLPAAALSKAETLLSGR